MPLLVADAAGSIVEKLAHTWHVEHIRAVFVKMCFATSAREQMDQTDGFAKNIKPFVFYSCCEMNRHAVLNSAKPQTSCCIPGT